MNMYKLIQSKRCGFAIPLAMLAVVILLAAGTGLLSLGLCIRIFSIRMSSDIAARSAADAGLTKAIYEMNEKLKAKPWDGNSLPIASNHILPNSKAAFDYTVTGDFVNGYTIESTGKYNLAEHSTHASLKLKGLFDYGILVNDTIILNPYTLVDGYNSEDINDTDVEVQIASVSNEPDSIILQPGATVDGDVLTGVDVDLPLMTPPELFDTCTDIEVRGSTLTIGPGDSGEYFYSSIDLSHTGGTAGILEIDGGAVVLYVTGDIDIGQDCEIVIRHGSSLTLYLDGDLKMGNSSGINNETGTPSNFVLYGTGSEEQQFDLKAKSEFCGVVYAPNADIIIRANSNIYGAFVGANFEIKSGDNLYYDIALRNIEMGMCFDIERWWE